MEQVRILAEQLFNAYSEIKSGAEPALKWADLSEQVQGKWMAVAKEARLRVGLLYTTNA